MCIKTSEAEASDPHRRRVEWYSSSEANVTETHLVGGVGEVRLLLGALGDSVVGERNATADVRARGGVGLEGVAVDADGRLSGLGAGLGGVARDGTGALGDGGVGGVEVGGDGRVLGQGEAGDALLDDLLLVGGVLVDDGLGCGDLGVGGDVATVGLRDLGLRLADVLLGHVESRLRHVGDVCGWCWLERMLVGVE
jgi:hypothetical protein